MTSERPYAVTAVAAATTVAMLFAEPAFAAPLIDGLVADPITSVVESAYVPNGILYTQDQVSGEFAGLLYQAQDAENLYFAFEQSVAINDNTYGTYAIDWHAKRGHKLKDLLQSEHAGVRLYDCNDELVLDFFLDYSSSDRETGDIGSACVTGGDGRMTVGDAASIVGCASSLDWNYNLAVPSYADRSTTSPARTPTNSYAPGTGSDPTAPWIYPLVYEWAVAKEAFGAAGYCGDIEILEVHNSPLKTGASNPVPQPVLSGYKSSVPASGTAVSNGESITYTLTFTNVGASPLTDTTITDVIDSNLSDVVPLSGGACSAPAACGAGDTLSWAVGTIEPGETVSVDFQAVVAFTPAGATILNSGLLSSASLPEPFVTNTVAHPCLDSDGDGVCDDSDVCPGTWDDQSDTDGDGTGDACDACPEDATKPAPGTCGCGTPDNDTDGDGTPDCYDNCPSDGGKTEPGQCGCGTPDTDTDGDGTPDCYDNCPSDDGKTEPGQCGCGTSDSDNDQDGTADCNDGCPSDAHKVAPGQCGCGTPDSDEDADGTADCLDGCPGDPEKTDPGQCGCGVADTDTDADAAPDCWDNCPHVANADQVDADCDAFGDACDTCPLDPWNDEDADGVCGDVDNCPGTGNADQADDDADRIGNACDLLPSVRVENCERPGIGCGTP